MYWGKHSSTVKGVMASKDKDTSPKSQTTTLATEENVAPQPLQRGLASITTSSIIEAGKSTDVIQKAQVSPDAAKGKSTKESSPSKERSSPQKAPPSPTVCARKYALEIWIKVELSPGVYAYPEDDTYSSDFVTDTLNLAYPGCTGVYLANAGHLVAFYGKKTKPGAGLSIKQGMEACHMVTKILTWMGSLAKYTVCAISTTEAQELVQGLKHLEKEDFHKVHLELSNKLSSLCFGQTNSSLSTSAKPFVPLATSSITAMGELPPGGTTLPLKGSVDATRPLYTTDDDGFTTDAVSLKKKKNRQGQRGKNHGHRSTTSDTRVSDCRSDTSATTMTTGGRHGRKKKKAGVNNKVNIPEFGGKDAHPHDVASAFCSWARIIAHYRDYYEDEYLMTQVIASLKGDAAGVFDWVRHNHHNTSDLGLIMEKIRNHYYSTLTFREQRNTVENMRQDSSEGAADFLVRVSNAVQTLNNYWKNHMTKEEMDTLQYEVSLNGVNEEFWHVLDSEVAKYGELEPAQMYNAVKCHEAYLSQNKHLQNKGTYSNQAKVPQQTPQTTFKPRYHKPTTFAVTTAK